MQIELELAKAREERLKLELQVLEQASSRGGSEAGSLADRLSLAGLGSQKQQLSQASGTTGAALSLRNPTDADDRKPGAEDMQGA